MEVDARSAAGPSLEKTRSVLLIAFFRPLPNRGRGKRQPRGQELLSRERSEPFRSPLSCSSGGGSVGGRAVLSPPPGVRGPIALRHRGRYRWSGPAAHLLRSP